jgi:hypothetical protein
MTLPRCVECCVELAECTLAERTRRSPLLWFAQS